MAIFARIGRLFRGFVSLFISGFEERNPEALMEAARQEFRDRMAQYNMALARMAGVAERLKAQIKMKTGRAQDLERRIMANHRAGNLQLAGSLARELQELRSDLQSDTSELAETEEAYQANLRQAKSRSAGVRREASPTGETDLAGEDQGSTGRGGGGAGQCRVQRSETLATP